MGYDLVVVGTSFGGLQALGALLEGLPREFGASLVIVQHRSKDSDETLPRLLQDRCLLPVREAEDKQAVEPGRVYVAPADYHLLVDGASFSLSTDPPVVFSRPSIDVLFESAAEAYRERLVGVVLTGANADGAKGLLVIRRLGGYAIVQTPETAVAPTMPAASIAIASPDEIVPLDHIAERLVALVGRGAAPHVG